MNWLETIMRGGADADALSASFPWAGAMIGCPHDAVFHAEGDPWVHTGMVAAALEAGDGFGDLPAARQEILRLAAWLHDIAKPMTTIVEFDEALQRERVRQPGHAALGAMMAWQGLIDQGLDPILARDVHAMVFWHQRPTHLYEQAGSKREGEQRGARKKCIRFGHEVSHVNWDDLLRLCTADQNGRVVKGGTPSLDELDLARIMLEEMTPDAGADMLTQSWHFETAAARLKYLRTEGPSASPWFTPPEPSGSRVIVLSGLPGAGKNTLLARDLRGLPTISFDDLREEMKMSIGDNQGRMLQEAFERAREFLRRGEDFVWNATCLTRRSRQKICGLALDYDASVEIHSIDLPLGEAIRRNRGRGDKAIPEAAVLAMAARREPALIDEAHVLVSYDSNLEGRMILETRRPETGTAPEAP